MQTPAYRDVQIVFKVTETALTDKTKRDIINTAEIAAHQDKDGNTYLHLAVIFYSNF